MPTKKDDDEKETPKTATEKKADETAKQKGTDEAKAKGYRAVEPNLPEYKAKDEEYARVLEADRQRTEMLMKDKAAAAEEHAKSAKSAAETAEKEGKETAKAKKE
jgi:hypothetical protein